MRLSTTYFSVCKSGYISQNNPANCQYTRGPVKVLKIEFLKILQILKIRTKLRTGPEIWTRTGPIDIRTENPDRTKKIRTILSGPRTGPKIYGAKNIRIMDQTITDRVPGNHGHRFTTDLSPIIDSKSVESLW